MMRKVDNEAYIGVLKELLADGKQVSLAVTGSSMEPFLTGGRDQVLLAPIKRPLKKGDLVLFQRENGAYVLHRILRVTSKGCILIGDGQQETEGPIERERILGVAERALRNGESISEGSFWWDFFAKIWIRIIPLRPVFRKLYGVWRRIRNGGKHENQE